MRREDFAVPVNSIIFSAEDMMESQLRLPKVGGAAPVNKAKLVLQEKDGETAWPLSDEFIMGRAGDLRLGDARVSRRHARIYLDGATYLVEDLKSSNGTFLNETKIAAPSPLKHGDVIRVGPFRMRFDLEQTVPGPTMPHDPMDPSQAMPPVAPAVQKGKPEAPSSGGAATLDLAGSAAAPDPSGDPLPTMCEGADQELVKIRLGQQTLSLPIGDHLPLSHSVSLAGLDLGGVAAAMVRRADGIWVEPIPGRSEVLHNGQPLKAPTQLKPGDRVQVGPVELTISN